MQQAAFTEAATLVIRWYSHLACFPAHLGTGHAGFLSMPYPKQSWSVQCLRQEGTHVIILCNLFPVLRGQVSEDASSVGDVHLCTAEIPQTGTLLPSCPLGPLRELLKALLTYLWPPCWILWLYLLSSPVALSSSVLVWMAPACWLSGRDVQSFLTISALRVQIFLTQT